MPQDDLTSASPDTLTRYGTPPPPEGSGASPEVDPVEQKAYQGVMKAAREIGQNMGILPPPPVEDAVDPVEANLRQAMPRFQFQQDYAAPTATHPPAGAGGMQPPPAAPQVPKVPAPPQGAAGGLQPPPTSPEEDVRAQMQSRAEQILRNPTMLPSREQFRESGERPEWNWWQRAIASAAFGGPREMQTELQSRQDQAYADFAQPALQRQQAEQAELKMILDQMPEYVRRVPVRLGDQTFNVPENLLGYIADDLIAQAQEKAAGKERVNLKQMFPWMQGLPDQEIDPNDVPSWLNAIRAAQESGQPDLEKFFVSHMQLPKEERDPYVVDAILQYKDGSNMNDNEFYRKFPDLYAEKKAIDARTKEAASPPKQKSLGEDDVGLRVQRLLSRPTSGLFDYMDAMGVNLEDLEERDQVRYGENYLFTNLREDPEYADAAKDWIRKNGIYFEGRRIKGPYNRAKNQLSKMVGKKDGITRSQYEAFLARHFPEEHSIAEDKAKEREKDMARGAARGDIVGPGADRMVRDEDPLGLIPTQ